MHVVQTEKVACQVTNPLSAFVVGICLIGRGAALFLRIFVCSNTLVDH